MKFIDKIAFIEIQQKKILSTRSKGKKTFYIPGGKRAFEESDSETLIREISEELAVTIKPNTIEYVGSFTAQSDGDSAGVKIIMTCYKAVYRGVLRASSEIEELRWLQYSDLDIISAVDKKIFQYLKDKGLLS
jgi:8-oxo-dGTP pyrophosphatase MutT (NUDIX family)